jgi:hypothetical protein
MLSDGQSQKFYSGFVPLGDRLARTRLATDFFQLAFGFSMKSASHDSTLFGSAGGEPFGGNCFANSQAVSKLGISGFGGSSGISSFFSKPFAKALSSAFREAFFEAFRAALKAALSGDVVAIGGWACGYDLAVSIICG